MKLNKHSAILLTLLVAILLLNSISSLVRGQTSECKCDYCDCGGFTCNIKSNKYNLVNAYCEYAPNTYVSHIAVQLKSTEKITVKTVVYTEGLSYVSGNPISGVSSSGSVSCFQGATFLTDTSINKYVTMFTCNNDGYGFGSCSAEYDTMSYCTDKTITVDNVLLTSDKTSIKSGDLIDFKTYLRDAQNSTLTTKASVSLRIESGIAPVKLYNVDSGRTYFSEGGIGDFKGVMLRSQQNQTVTLVAKYVQSGKFLESRVYVNVVGDPLFNNASRMSCGLVGFVLVLILTFTL